MKINLVFLIGLLVSCAKVPHLDENLVKNHLSFLSGDELKGRYAFRPEISKAEDYIVNQYQKMGLKTFAKYPDYFHSFTMSRFSVIAEKSELLINSKKVENVVFSANSNFQSEQNEKTWNTAEIALVDLSKYENVNELMRELFAKMQTKASAIYLLNEKHFTEINSFLSYVNRPRFELGEANEKVIKLIVKKPKEQVKSFKVTVEVQHNTFTLRNTIAYLEGNDPNLKNEYIMFGAHHDHIGVSSNLAEEDSIFNGAQDDASGVTGVLALASLYAKDKTNKRSIIFATFTAEEVGMYGSGQLANNLPIEKESLKAMINLEMIGAVSKFGKNKAFLTGFTASTLGNILHTSIKDSTVFQIFPDPYPSMNLYMRSDNVSFVRQNIVSHTISTFDMEAENTVYHKANDDINSVDISNLEQIVFGIFHASVNLMNGLATPVLQNE